MIFIKIYIDAGHFAAKLHSSARTIDVVKS